VAVAAAPPSVPPSPSGRVKWQFQFKGRWRDLDQVANDLIEGGFTSYQVSGTPFEVEYTVHSGHIFVVNFKYMNSTPKGGGRRNPIQRIIV
jgi:hypothetical protein